MATNINLSTRLAVEREAFVHRRQRLLGAFRKATESQRANRMNHLFRQLQQVNRSIEMLDAIAQAT